jgi:hypothetical protein
VQLVDFVLAHLMGNPLAEGRTRYHSTRQDESTISITLSLVGYGIVCFLVGWDGAETHGVGIVALYVSNKGHPYHFSTRKGITVKKWLKREETGRTL